MVQRLQGEHVLLDEEAHERLVVQLGVVQAAIRARRPPGRRLHPRGGAPDIPFSANIRDLAGGGLLRPGRQRRQGDYRPPGVTAR